MLEKHSNIGAFFYIFALIRNKVHNIRKIGIIAVIHRQSFVKLVRGRCKGLEPIRVMLIDDHPVVRRGLRSLLSQYPDMEVVGESDGGPDVMQVVNEARPDIILLDIRLADRNGLRLAKTLRQTHPQLRIIVLTSYEDKDYLLQAVQAGIRGYLLKSASAEFLAQAIRDVRAGEWSLSPTMGGKALENLGAVQQASLNFQSGLTDEELHLLRLIADGETNQNIAQTLYLSERSVKRKTQVVLEKLGATNRAQAVAEAFRRGLL